MIVAMNVDASAEEVQQVVDKIESYDLKALNMPGGERTAIGIASAIPPELRYTLSSLLEAMPGVDKVTHVSRIYKLTSREFQSVDTVFEVKDVVFGSKKVVVIAGPCAIESKEQLFKAAEAVRNAGGKVLRGGAFKPRSSPYSFQGLGLEGLKLLKEAGEKYGLVTVTEVMDHHDLDMVAEYADIIQIGARNMQNFPLLVACGKKNHPVLLKRGSAAVIDEWLLAAEYILAQGNTRVILCERGVHPLDKVYTRYTLDISAVPVAKHLSHLPVIVDPSHAAGSWHYVIPLSTAAIAAGADGLIVEIHPNPSEALCDGHQALNLDSYRELMAKISAIADAVGRSMA
ncbi:MAG: 3-deoxy-7-phosphoheptulonate synthase [Armatimonadota bacterium]